MESNIERFFKKGQFDELRKRNIVDNVFLAVVWFDNDPEFWIVVGDIGKAELTIKYQDEWGKDRGILIEYYDYLRLMDETI